MSDSLREKLRAKATEARRDKAQAQSQEKTEHTRHMEAEGKQFASRLVSLARGAAREGKTSVMIAVDFKYWEDNDFRRAVANNIQDLGVAYDSDGYTAHYVTVSWD